MAIYREFAPAKINLTLEVLGKRPDGYHELRSLVAFASDVGDVVTLDTAKPVGVTVSGPFGGSIAGANLIDTTLRLIAQAAPDLQLGAVHLEKNLPVAAGIGGGSADAAAVIRAVQRANGSSGDWTRVATTIGADVPVCLISQLSWVRGIGEIVTRVALPEEIRIYAVVANPLVSMPQDKTAQVFKWLAARPVGDIPEHRAPMFASFTDVLEFALLRGNDLSYAATRVAPIIRDVERTLAADPGNLYAAISGAGPTCFALFDTIDEARAATAALSASQPDWWVRATALS